MKKSSPLAMTFSVKWCFIRYIYLYFCLIEKISVLFQAIAEKFLEGDLDIDGFLEQFTASRKVMHLRRVKADKMSEILKRQHNAAYPPQSYTHHTAPSYVPLPPVYGSVPYPVRGVNMPMSGSYGPNVF